MKLNRLQRHTAYILMLAVYKEMGFGCLCSAWDTLTKDNSWRKMNIILPELFQKRTRGIRCDQYWFYETKERIEALKQCINETA